MSDSDCPEERLGPPPDWRAEDNDWDIRPPPPTVYPPEVSNAPETPWERIPPSIEVVLCLALTVGAIACVWGGWELFRWLVRLALK